MFLDSVLLNLQVKCVIFIAVCSITYQLMARTRSHASNKVCTDTLTQSTNISRGKWAQLYGITVQVFIALCCTKTYNAGIWVLFRYQQRYIRICYIASVHKTSTLWYRISIFHKNQEHENSEKVARHFKSLCMWYDEFLYLKPLWL